MGDPFHQSDTRQLPRDGYNKMQNAMPLVAVLPVDLWVHGFILPLAVLHPPLDELDGFV